MIILAQENVIIVQMVHKRLVTSLHNYVCVYGSERETLNPWTWEWRTRNWEWIWSWRGPLGPLVATMFCRVLKVCGREREEGAYRRREERKGTLGVCFVHKESSIRELMCVEHS